MIGPDLKFMSLDKLRESFGEELKEGVSLARYSAARLGGPADALLEASSVNELVRVVSTCWQNELPFVLLGGGSNVLISDRGVRGLVVINRARKSHFNERTSPPTVWAESGANFGVVARQAAQRGLAGLEWAAGIPGTVGGAVVGNAGAHGGDMAGSLILAEILHCTRADLVGEPVREEWPVEQLEFTYRSSLLKRQPGQAVVLAARIRLEHSTSPTVQARIDEFVAYRRKTQPPGASMGSMFKNPPGDYAGRLIEAVGLKGARIGDAEISPLHANFFINRGRANAEDVLGLIMLTRQKVFEQFGVELELEIELLGEW